MVTVKNIVISDVLEYNGVSVLTYKIEYPEFVSELYQMSLVVINKYYKTKALEFENYCKTELYNTIITIYKTQLEQGIQIPNFEALLEYKITYLSLCIISLYSDRYEFVGGSHGLTTRDSQTWNLQKSDIIQLNELVGCPPDYKMYILKAIKDKIEQDKTNYFEDYEKLIKEKFNENNFYCTLKGLVIYFQIYEIAPYAGGISEFLILYSDCMSDPKTTCFI
ncbi:MAG TPA: hypothetical protein DCP51_04905 [Clostridiales bacterium]|nr:hypothetical protein [Clostridiales bacterium]